MSPHHHHHHGHGHGHGHGHEHHEHAHGHHGITLNSAFALAVTLNIGFVGVEVVFGFISNSMALIADAGHNLSDVMALLMSWGASALTRRGPTWRYTYGLGSTSILAALFNAILLLLAVGAIALEAVFRLFAPAPVAGTTMMAVAAVGIIINTATALLFLSGRKSDLNVRSAFLHMSADAATSAGVVLAGMAILFTGWLWVDPLVSLVIAGIIVAGTWNLLRDSVNMTLNAVPAGIDPLAVRAYLGALPGVTAVHDLHIWSISTRETALTSHLVMPGGHPGDDTMAHIAHELHKQFGIGHATLQIERSGEICALAPDDVV